MNFGINKNSYRIIPKSRRSLKNFCRNLCKFNYEILLKGDEMFVKNKIVKSIVVLFALGFLVACSDTKAPTDAKFKGADLAAIQADEEIL